MQTELSFRILMQTQASNQALAVWGNIRAQTHDSITVDGVGDYPAIGGEYPWAILQEGALDLLRKVSLDLKSSGALGGH